MSNTPNNPFEPNPPEKGPWLYSGAQQPVPAYTPPPEARPVPAPTPTNAADPMPPADASPTPAAPVAKPKTAGAGAPKAADKSDDTSLGSIIDTIEAVVIALILALTFRAFIIEAFVIPTGSMAPTLLGAHFNVVCPQCGYVFARDASLYFQEANNKISYQGQKPELTSNSSVPADGLDASALVCPNCKYIIPYEKLPQFIENRPIQEDHRPGKAGGVRRVPFAWANNGDRILVLKYIYSVMDPARYDVIVFKEPMAAQDNFIKRLIGLPRETIEVIGGEIYVGAPGKTKEEDLWIARKPLYVQRDVWQNVFDMDFYPTDEGKKRYKEVSMPGSFSEWHNPWTGAGATKDNWNRKPEVSSTGPVLKTVGGPVIHYDAAGPGMLEFNAVRNDPYTYNILGYNNDIRDLYKAEATAPLLPVGDLRLETTWTPQDAAGESVALAVGADRNRFKVQWSKDGLELLHYNAAVKNFVSVKKDATVEGPKAGRAYNIAINNVDHAVEFFIDGKLVLQHETPWNAVMAHQEEEAEKEALDSRNGSVMEALAPHIEVSVGGACTLGHLKVLRDLYYTQSAGGRGRANSGYPLTLGEDEYFAMGDNSRESNDGRTWNTVFPALDDLGTRRGIVPKRYLLGKAIFVYWPAGFQFSDKFWWMPPLVPNTGDMRFIR